MVTRRERLREATRNEILDIARRQMAESGAAALSLRAIARDMELTAPALYRYFRNRDDLVTALILDAYHSLADALEGARDAQPDPGAQLEAMVMAYRDWALSHPEDWALIFGTPIPGYDAPRESTVPAAARSFNIFVGVIAAAMHAGMLVAPPEYTQLPLAVEEALKQVNQNEGYGLPMPALYMTAVGWTQMHGLIMLEIFGHTGPVVGNTGEFYRFQMQNMFKHMGLKTDQGKMPAHDP